MFSGDRQVGVTVNIYFMDTAGPVANDLCDEELTLFKAGYKKIHSLELRILKLHTAKLYDRGEIRQFRQQIDHAEGEIVKILSKTTM